MSDQSIYRCSRCRRPVPPGTAVTVESQPWTAAGEPDESAAPTDPTPAIRWLLCAGCVHAANAFVHDTGAELDPGLPALQVLPLPDGRFVVRAYYSTGKTMADSTFDTRDEAEAFARKIAKAL